MVLYFRCFRKELRKQHHVHLTGTEDAATPEYWCKVRGDLYIYRAYLPVLCREYRDGGPAIYFDGL
jgi:hypothetical protein